MLRLPPPLTLTDHSRARRGAPDKICLVVQRKSASLISSSAKPRPPHSLCPSGTFCFPPGLFNTLYGLAQLHIQPNAEWKARYWEAAARIVDAYSPQEACMTLHSASQLEGARPTGCAGSRLPTAHGPLTRRTPVGQQPLSLQCRTSARAQPASLRPRQCLSPSIALGLGSLSRTFLASRPPLLSHLSPVPLSPIPPHSLQRLPRALLGNHRPPPRVVGPAAPRHRHLRLRAAQGGACARLARGVLAAGDAQHRAVQHAGAGPPTGLSVFTGDAFSPGR